VRVAPLMLRHIKGRPLSFVRCPAGSGSSCFFQKHLPPGVESTLRTVSIRHKNGEQARYAVVSTAAELISLVQYGVLEFHVWGCRADQVERPDRIVFDLDPGDNVPWTHVVEGAFLLRELLRKQRLESWVKTTGGKGLHVVIPIARMASWDDVHDFARDVAEGLAADYPGDFLSKASKAARSGKIFVDWLRNLRGATWIAPWSTRAREGAPVSVPVAWQRLRSIESGAQYTIASLGKRRISIDPWSGITAPRQTIG
jgi:bifunctional non-homologous end joining protein LigD